MIAFHKICVIFPVCVGSLALNCFKKNTTFCGQANQIEERLLGTQALKAYWCHCPFCEALEGDKKGFDWFILHNNVWKLGARNLGYHKWSYPWKCLKLLIAGDIELLPSCKLIIAHSSQTCFLQTNHLKIGLIQSLLIDNW